MAKLAFTEEIKTRVPADWKQRLQAIADSEGELLSTIGRRAFAEFLRRNRKKKTPAVV